MIKSKAMVEICCTLCDEKVVGKKHQIFGVDQIYCYKCMCPEMREEGACDECDDHRDMGIYAPCSFKPCAWSMIFFKHKIRRHGITGQTCVWNWNLPTCTHNNYSSSVCYECHDLMDKWCPDGHHWVSKLVCGRLLWSLRSIPGEGKGEEQEEEEEEEKQDEKFRLPPGYRWVVDPKSGKWSKELKEQEQKQEKQKQQEQEQEKEKEKEQEQYQQEQEQE